MSNFLESNKSAKEWLVEGRNIVGDRYNSELTTREITAILRKEIREFAKKNGAKVGVTFESFSGGSAINVSIKDFRGELYSKEYVEYLKQFDNGTKDFYKYLEDNNLRMRTPRYSKEMVIFKEKLKEMLDSYNRDDSDIMTDYFDVKFYGSVDVDYDFSEREDAKYSREI